MHPHVHDGGDDETLAPDLNFMVMPYQRIGAV